MDVNLITYLACICFIFIFGRIFIVPLKKILKLIFNSVLGGACIYLINLVGATFGFHIGLNFLTSVIIRIIRITWCGMLDYCETFSWLMVKSRKLYVNIICVIITKEKSIRKTKTNYGLTYRKNYRWKRKTKVRVPILGYPLCFFLFIQR